MTVYIGGSSESGPGSHVAQTIEAVRAAAGDIDFISSDASVAIAGDDSADTIDFTVAAGMIIDDHGLLSGLADDDHTQYSLAAGTRPFTSPVGGVNPAVDADLATKDYVDQRDVGHVHQHGNLSGIGVGDHHSQLHGAEHVLGGGDPIDGDSLDIDFSPSTYAATSSVLSGHLQGIDNALAAQKVDTLASSTLTASLAPGASEDVNLTGFGSAGTSLETLRITPDGPVDSYHIEGFPNDNFTAAERMYLLSGVTVSTSGIVPHEDHNFALWDDDETSELHLRVINADTARTVVFALGVKGSTII